MGKTILILLASTTTIGLSTNLTYFATLLIMVNGLSFHYVLSAQ